MDKQNLFSIKFNNEGSRIIKYILNTKILKILLLMDLQEQKI